MAVEHLSVEGRREGSEGFTTQMSAEETATQHGQHQGANETVMIGPGWTHRE